MEQVWFSDFNNCHIEVSPDMFSRFNCSGQVYRGFIQNSLPAFLGGTNFPRKLFWVYYNKTQKSRIKIYESTLKRSKVSLRSRCSLSGEAICRYCAKFYKLPRHKTPRNNKHILFRVDSFI